MCFRLGVRVSLSRRIFVMQHRTFLGGDTSPHPKRVSENIDLFLPCNTTPSCCKRRLLGVSLLPTRISGNQHRVFRAQSRSFLFQTLSPCPGRAFGDKRRIFLAKYPITCRIQTTAERVYNLDSARRLTKLHLPRNIMPDSVRSSAPPVLQAHLPLITPRAEFQRAILYPLPLITPRATFDNMPPGTTKISSIISPDDGEKAVSLHLLTQHVIETDSYIPETAKALSVR